jgi:recombination protein RecA
MSSEKEAKLKALQLTLDKLDKTYGKGTVMKMGDKAIEEVETISFRFIRFRFGLRCKWLSKR